jgi:uncharacterized lipoprotein YmbA
MNRKAITLIIAGLLIPLLCLGCAGRKSVTRDTFLLEAQWEGTKAEAGDETVLAIQPFSIAPAFQGKGLVYRTGENQYESDFYHEYFVSPAPMMTDQTRNWLSDSGVFGQVLSPISSVKPTHVLEGHIKQIVADLRDRKNPQAVLEISFFLIEQNKQGRSICYRKTYLETLPLESKTAADCIDALNGCLGQILTDLEKDLASNLAQE